MTILRCLFLLLLPLLAACDRSAGEAGLPPDAHDADHTHEAAGAHDDHAEATRTTILAEVAREAGIAVEVAGPAVIRDRLRVMGTVAIDANRRAQVKARFPGIVREVRVLEGQRVRRGDTLLIVEGNDSLRNYAVAAPIDGIVLARHTSVGDVTGDAPLVELADLSQLWVDLRAVGRDAARLRSGQTVQIASATSDAEAVTVIDRLLPVAAAGQGVIARVLLPNPDATWRPGMTVTAQVTLTTHEVPLAVKESALQSLHGTTVVFVQEDAAVYAARAVELGARDGEHAEVVAGLLPGTRYVTRQSYLIRADLEKSDAGHAH